MATRKQARRSSLIHFLTLLVGVSIIVVVVVLAQNWFNHRPGTPPQDVALHASVGDKQLRYVPYLTCEMGSECPEGEIPNLPVAPDETLKITLPREVSNHGFQVVAIYDDPAANDQQLHGVGETTEVTIPGSVDPVSTGDPQKRPHLQVVEVSTILIGRDAKGEEAPVNTVWSLSTMTAEELAQSLVK